LGTPAKNPAEYDHHYSGKRDLENFTLSYSLTNNEVNGKKELKLIGELTRVQLGKMSDSPLIPDQKPSVVIYQIDGTDNGLTDAEKMFTIYAKKDSNNKHVLADQLFFLSEKCEGLKNRRGSLCLWYYPQDKDDKDKNDKDEAPAIEIEMRPKTRIRD